MEDPHDTQKQPRAWRGLRFLPLGLMLDALILALILFLLGGMPRVAGWYVLQYVAPLLGVLCLLGSGIYVLVRRRADRVLGATVGTAVLSLLPIALWFVPVAYPASLARTTPAATVRLPADGPLQVAWGGDTPQTNYHVITPDQRWAYDLFVEPYVSGSDRLEDYGCYGVPVVAPAAGLVSQAHDGEADETPGVISNNRTAPKGNYVVLQLPETGTYLLIAHLKQGSVAVQTGDTVAEGQLIGQCGNSGNTSEPHIHIHHQRQDPAVYPLNFAEGLPLYFRDHDGPAMPLGGFAIVGETAVATGNLVRHVGR
ncbi:MAG: M23 family metallopeptidase [Anaerolineales bacterium]|nr:M23 family metallopeptidase [Anaerolineales bacterium]